MLRARSGRSDDGEELMATFDALHVPPTALEHGGVEVLRAAIVEGGLHVSLRRAFDDPQAWGMLIADVARHAARIFAKETKLSEEEALNAFARCSMPRWTRRPILAAPAQSAEIDHHGEQRDRSCQSRGEAPMSVERTAALVAYALCAVGLFPPLLFPTWIR